MFFHRGGLSESSSPGGLSASWAFAQLERLNLPSEISQEEYPFRRGGNETAMSSTFQSISGNALDLVNVAHICCFLSQPGLDRHPVGHCL